MRSVGVRRCLWSVALNKAPNGEAEPYFDRSRQVWVAPWRKPDECSAPWPRGSAPKRRLGSCRPGGSIMGHSMTPINDTDPLDSTTSSFVAVFAVFAAVWARGVGPDEFCGSQSWRIGSIPTSPSPNRLPPPHTAMKDSNDLPAQCSPSYLTCDAESPFDTRPPTASFSTCTSAALSPAVMWSGLGKTPSCCATASSCTEPPTSLFPVAACGRDERG